MWIILKYVVNFYLMMSKNIASVGLILLIVGSFLALAFWPFFGVSAVELADDADGAQYRSYDEGDTELVYGSITDVIMDGDEAPSPIGYLIEEFVNAVAVELDDDLVVIFAEESSTEFDVGDEVYGRLTLNEEESIFEEKNEFWVHDGDMRSKDNIDYLSYGLIGAGIAVTGLGVIKD